ncbi:MAG: YggT family protein [SAR324 cluster bacterium]|nr:YggT family protein [SAR324 cluster bacterium]
MASLLDTIAQISCWGLFIYKWIIIIAIMITWVGADPYNPLVLRIQRITRPYWNWCRRWMPHRMSHFDVYASLLFLIFLQVLIPASLRSIAAFTTHEEINTMLLQFGGHLIQGIALTVQSLIMFLIFILAAWIFLTMISPSMNNPLVRVIFVLADPLITPLQQYLPRTKIDLSPWLGISFFLLVDMLVITPLFRYGFMLSFPIRLCVI